MTSPPAPLRTWRCKIGPRRLAELEGTCAPGGAGIGGGSSRPSGSLSTPSPPPPAADAPTRSKTVRLARLNQGLMRRLGDVRLPNDDRDPWGAHATGPSDSAGRMTPPAMSGGVNHVRGASFEGKTFLPGSHVALPDVDVPRKWSLSLPASRRPSLQRRQRVSSGPAETIERDRERDHEHLIGSLNLQQVERPVMPDGQDLSLGRGNALELGSRELASEDRETMMREIEALRRHCVCLEETVRNDSRMADSFQNISSSHFRLNRDCEDETRRLREELQASLDREEVAMMRAVHHAGLLEQERRQLATENSERKAAVQAQQQAENRLAQVIAAEITSRNRAIAAEAHARRARDTALTTALSRSKFCDRGVIVAIFGAWHAEAVESRLVNRAQAQAELRSEAEAAEAAAESARRLALRRAGIAEAAAAEESSRLRARATAAEARLSCAEALHETSTEEAERLHRKEQARTQENERRSLVAAYEQEARYRSELAAMTTMKRAEMERALQDQAAAAEITLKEKLSNLDQNANEKANALAETFWQNRCNKSCPVCSARKKTQVQPRVHALKGASMLIAVQTKVLQTCVFAFWRLQVGTQKGVAALQAKIFSETSSRASALRAQKLDLDYRYMEAEARHRAALRRVRAELAEAESRHADALAQQEHEAVQRLSAVEVDFSRAIRQVASGSSAEAAFSSISRGTNASNENARCDSAGSSAETDTDNCKEGIAALEEAIDLIARGTANADSDNCLNAIPSCQIFNTESNWENDVGNSAAVAAENRLTEVLQSLRTRSDERLAENEARHAEAFSAERERAEIRIVREERRQEEALRAARESADRRVLAYETKQAKAFHAFREHADARISHLEVLNGQLKSLLQASGLDDVIADLSALDFNEPELGPTATSPFSSSTATSPSESFMFDVDPDVFSAEGGGTF